MIPPLHRPPTVWIDRGVNGRGAPVIKARLFPKGHGPMVLELIGDDAEEAAWMILDAQAAKTTPADARKETI